MSRVTHKEQTSASKPTPEQTADKLPHVDHKSREELGAEMDALLDEIEDVLEENAEAFVADFIQGNGE